MRNIVCFLLVVSSVLSQTRKLPCTSPPEIRAKLSALQPTDADYKTRIAAMAAEYPEDLSVQLAYLRSNREEAAPRYTRLSAEHPSDPLYLFLQAQALLGKDTRKSIDLLSQAIRLDPNFAQAHAALADAYSYQNFSDHAKVQEHLEIAAKTCALLPDSTLLLVARQAPPELQKKVASATRADIEANPDQNSPWRVSFLWEIEFRIVPVPQQDELRAQVERDMKHIAALPQSRARDDVLNRGNRLLGRTQTPVTVFDAIRSFDKDHPRPIGMVTEDKRAEYQVLELAATQEWTEKWPEDTNAWSRRLSAVSSGRNADKSLIEQTGQKMLELSRKQQSGPIYYPPIPVRVAEVWIMNNIRLNDAPGLIDEGIELMTKRTPPPADDRFQGPDMMVPNGMIGAASALLSLAEKQPRPDLVVKAVEILRKTEPKIEFSQMERWRLLAKACELQGRKVDALGYYQKAARRGIESYDVKRIWRELGGTEESLGFLLAGQGKPVEAGSGGNWSKPEKPLPSFNLTDMSGKTWRLSTMEGKTVLINIWATWCGPCVAEHPRFQQLYTKLKDRSDVVVLTFNIDHEIADVQPYLKKNNYTFPVILAQSFVNDMLPQVSIPRNWIVDTKGTLAWEQIGFNSGASFEADILAKLAH